MTFEFHPEARHEFIEAIAYYKKCREGLGSATFEGGLRDYQSNSSRPKRLAEDLAKHEALPHAQFSVRHRLGDARERSIGHRGQPPSREPFY